MKQLHRETGESHERRPMDIVVAFLTRHRTTIAVVLGVIVVAVVALVIVLSVVNARTEQALSAADTLQQDFDDWLDTSEAEQPDAYTALAESAREIIDTYPRTYAAARARIIDARALAELERWEAAVDRYVEVADLLPETYLAPVSLMDAAVAAENGGDTERALALHGRIADEYDGESAEVTRALFSIGRINEQRDEVAAAAEAYRRLVEDYPASSWTNLARNRIITLTVEGRIGG